MPPTGPLARKPQLPQPVSAEGVDVRTYDGFGRPWSVIPRAAFLWSRLNGGENTGTAKKGCIVGEQLRLALPDGLRIRLPRTSNELYEPQWACPVHEQAGVSMEEVDMSVGIRLDSCQVASTFRKVYEDVIGLCYSRIYEDNVDTLWAGDRGRLPGREVVEAKLFRPFTSVLHATSEQLGCVGGAIVHNLRVPSMQFGTQKMCTVTYVDDFATVRGSRAGKVLWTALTSTAADLVVLHSVVVQGTLAFWNSCGLRRIDPSSKEDNDWLVAELFTKSRGAYSVDVEDLLAVLPKSDLPLLVCCLGRGSVASESPESALFPLSAAGPDDVRDEA